MSDYAGKSRTTIESHGLIVIVESVRFVLRTRVLIIVDFP